MLPSSADSDDGLYGSLDPLRLQHIVVHPPQIARHDPRAPDQSVEPDGPHTTYLLAERLDDLVVPLKQRVNPVVAAVAVGANRQGGDGLGADLDVEQPERPLAARRVANGLDPRLARVPMMAFMTIVEPRW